MKSLTNFLMITALVISMFTFAGAKPVDNYNFYTKAESQALEQTMAARIDSMFLTESAIVPQSIFVKPFNSVGPPCSCTDRQAQYRYMVVIEGQPPECLEQCGPLKFSMRAISDRTYFNKRFVHPLN